MSHGKWVRGVTDEAVLDWIRLYWDRFGYSPSVREIARGVGLTSTSSTLAHLQNLEKASLIDRTPGIARTIRVLA